MPILPYADQGLRTVAGRRGPEGPQGIQGDRGPAGFMATGAAEDQDAIAGYIKAEAGANPVSTELDARIAGQASDPESVVGAALNGAIGSAVPPLVTAFVPPAVVDALTANETVAAAAADAVAVAASEADLVASSTQPDTAAAAGGILRDSGERTWLEFDATNKPTPNAAALMDEGYMRRHSILTTALAIGDSLTAASAPNAGGTDAAPVAGRWYTLLGQRLGITINVAGISGQNSNEIMGRFGGKPMVCYVQTPANQIPSSGTLTLYSPDIRLLRAGVYGEAAPIKVMVRDVNGVNYTGTLSQVDTAGTQFSLVLDIYPPAAVAVGQIEVWSIQHLADYERLVFVCMGTNDEDLLPGSPTATDIAAVGDNVLANYRRCTELLTPTRPRFVVWGPLDRGTTEAAGTQNGDLIRYIEAGLRRQYGPLFCDVRNYLASARALSDAGRLQSGFSATSDDTAAVAVNTVPPSFRVDPTSVHLGQPLGQLMLAHAFQMHLTAPTKGWF